MSYAITDGGLYVQTVNSLTSETLIFPKIQYRAYRNKNSVSIRAYLEETNTVNPGSESVAAGTKLNYLNFNYGDVTAITAVSDDDLYAQLQAMFLDLSGGTELSGLFGSPLLEVSAITVSALPAGTYNNGAGGVGATFTVTANGVFPTINTIAPALNAKYLVNNQVSKLQNGVYVLTTLGTAGTQAVLTRDTGADTTAELQPCTVFVGAVTGVNPKSYWTQATLAPTVGASSLIFLKGIANGATIALPDTQVAFGNGVGVTSSSFLTWLDTSKVLSAGQLGGGGNAGKLILSDVGGGTSTGFAQLGFGNIAGVKDAGFFVDNQNFATLVILGKYGVRSIAAGDVYMGQVWGVGNSTQVIVQDAAQIIQLLATNGVDATGVISQNSVPVLLTDGSTDGATVTSQTFDNGITSAGRILFAKGVDVASAADMTLGNDGNTFTITGAATINNIDTTGWTEGTPIWLAFSGAAILTHANSGDGQMILSGALDFLAASNDVIQLILVGTDWMEVPNRT